MRLCSHLKGINDNLVYKKHMIHERILPLRPGQNIMWEKFHVCQAVDKGEFSFQSINCLQLSVFYSLKPLLFSSSPLPPFWSLSNNIFGAVDYKRDEKEEGVKNITS